MKKNEVVNYDCPCGYGKNIPLGTINCPSCGMDLKPLNQLYSISNDYIQKGIATYSEGNTTDALLYFQSAINNQILDDNPLPFKNIIEIFQERKDYADALYFAKLAFDKFQNKEWDDLIKKLEKLAAEKEQQAQSEKEKINQIKSRYKKVIYLIGSLLMLFFISTFILWINKNNYGSAKSLAKAANQLNSIIKKDESLNSLLTVSSDNKVHISGKIAQDKLAVLYNNLTEIDLSFKYYDISNLAIVLPEEKLPERVSISYKMHEGESLTKIASSFYGENDIWKEIYANNKSIIKNPNYIKKGTELKILVHYKKE